MLRRLILLLLASGVVLVALPFLVSSLYIGQRGITIPGRVYFKGEDVTVHNGSWKRSSRLTIEYSPPDTAGVAFLGVSLPPEQYDGFHAGQSVGLRYLRRQDVPNLPLAGFLRELHVLPTARFAGGQALPAWKTYFAREATVAGAALVAMVALLFLWRLSGLPGFGWAVAVALVLSAAVLLVNDFPTRTPRPVADVRLGAGKVTSISRIDRLFAGSRQRGVETLQPVDVVGVEFVPEGRTESVVAVDLIDAGSLPGLKKGSPVGIAYESRSPRTAYIENAKRTFVGRNLAGAAEQGAVYLLVVGGLLAGAHYFGRVYKRLLDRRQ